MNDKELADKIVALLPDFHDWGCRPGQASERYGTLNWHLPKIAHDFVRDWRVVGALMEKCWSVEIDKIGCPWWVAAERAEKPQRFRKAENESLPRAIIEACVEALT